MPEQVSDEELNKHFSTELGKLFSGKYEVTVTNNDDGSTLNFTELLRLVIKTTQNISQKILDLEAKEHHKRQKSMPLKDYNELGAMDNGDKYIDAYYRSTVKEDYAGNGRLPEMMG